MIHKINMSGSHGGHGGGGGAMTDLKWAIGLLVVLWFAWYFTGGSTSPNTDKPFIKPAAPLDTGEVYGPN